MKISKNNKMKKIIFVSLAVALVVILGYVWYSHKYQIWPFTPNDKVEVELNSSDSTNPQKKLDNDIKVDGVDDTKNSSEVPISDTVSIAITSLSQAGPVITYSADIINPSATGICSASFTKEGSRPVNRDDIISNDKCGPFSISANTFDSLGEWTLTLRYFANDIQAVATSTIEVK